MPDDITVAIDNSEAEQASQEARIASENANMATAMAIGASQAQASLVGQVLEAAREDSQQAAIDAEIAAKEAELAATDAVVTNAAVLAQFQIFQTTLLERLNCIEKKLDDKEGDGSEETQDNGVIPIGEETEEGNDKEETKESHKSPKRKRRYGRR